MEDKQPPPTGPYSLVVPLSFKAKVVITPRSISNVNRTFAYGNRRDSLKYAGLLCAQV